MKYLTVVLLTFLVASCANVLGVFVLQSLDQIGTADTDMKNLPYGIAIGFNLFLALGTFPTFLNLMPRVRNNIFWSTLSFFLLPLVIMSYLAFSLEEEVLTGIGFCIPYFIVLTVFFVRLRKQNDV